MACDLHAHSYFSDGSLSPTELVKEAVKENVAAVALTDHNTTKGLPEFLSAAADFGVVGVAGTELSTDYGDAELHIVGLFLPESSYAAIEERVLVLQKNKEVSNLILCENLRKGGYDITVEEAKASSQTGFVNRAVIASVLMKKGYVPSVSAAFDTLLKKGGGFYDEPKRLDALETVKFLKDLGAAVVLAHPFLSLDEDGLREFLTKAVPLGLCGMETEYSTFTAEQTAKAKQIAAEFGLLESGGSDFHGKNKPHIRLGKGEGNLCIPDAFYLSLRACAKGNLREMKLKSDPFAKIAAGEKTVELRLYDEKRRQIQTGDLIRFTEQQTGKTLFVKVTGVKTFASFQELYAAYDKQRLGYGADEIALPEDMEQYYSAEEMQKFGVVGIEIELV